MDTTGIGKKAIKVVALLVLLVVVAVTGYVYASLNWSYSQGDRVGYVQKFSEKGWVLKTWEGELQMLPVPGALPEKFLFSVRKKDVIAKLNASLGKKVAVTYQQHKGRPVRLFGDSEYFIVDVKPLE